MKRKLLGAGLCGLVLLMLWVRAGRGRARVTPLAEAGTNLVIPAEGAVSEGKRSERWLRMAHPTEERTAEEVVQEKLAKFARSRRDLAEKLAQKNGVSMTPEVKAFFAAVESGDWSWIEKTFNVINGGDSSAGHADQRSPEASKMWPAIIDAFGVPEQVNLLPAKTLLDYGHSILDSLRPGMVYVGGTDASRWVPALVNDTEEGDNHIVITQNGLADASYAEYVALQFEDRMNTLTEGETKDAFDGYVEDARKRLEHDQKFPDEPKQIRPEEEVKVIDGRVNVGGKTAVMDINERLLNRLLEKNSDLTFAVGESVPMTGTYGDAAPLGPLMELRANASGSFTAERAADSLEYWRNTAEVVMTDPEASASESAKKNYSHDAAAAARLLSAHGFQAEAEEAYQVGRTLWPGNPEVTASLAQLYQKSGREEEAQRLVDDFVRGYPSEGKALKEVWGLEVKGQER